VHTHIRIQPYPYFYENQLSCLRNRIARARGSGSVVVWTREGAIGSAGRSTRAGSRTEAEARACRRKTERRRGRLVRTRGDAAVAARGWTARGIREEVPQGYSRMLGGMENTAPGGWRCSELAAVGACCLLPCRMRALERWCAGLLCCLFVLAARALPVRKMTKTAAAKRPRCSPWDLMKMSVVARRWLPAVREDEPNNVGVQPGAPL